MSLEEIADELYRLPLSEFTSSRDARAAEAARAGDRELSAAVKKLQKPTTGAWLANLLAHERPEDVEKLTELGAALRAAQGRLAGDDLRRLSHQRQELVQALAAEALRLGRQAGQAVGDPVVAELHETLEAALSDEEAGRALQSGRLARRLRHTGLGLGDVTSNRPRKGPAKGKGGAGPVASRPRSSGPGPGPDAERLQVAKAAAVEARGELTRQRANRERAERELDRIVARIGELDEEMRAVRSDAEHARKAVRAAKAQEQGAQRAEARAEGELRRLER